MTGEDSKHYKDYSFQTYFGLGSFYLLCLILHSLALGTHIANSSRKCTYTRRSLTVTLFELLDTDSFSTLDNMYRGKFEDGQGKCQIRKFAYAKLVSLSHRSQFFYKNHLLRTMDGMIRFYNINAKDQEKLYYVGVVIEDLRSDQVATRISAMKRLSEISTV